MHCLISVIVDLVFVFDEVLILYCWYTMYYPCTYLHSFVVHIHGLIMASCSPKSTKVPRARASLSCTLSADNLLQSPNVAQRTRRRAFSMPLNTDSVSIAAVDDAAVATLLSISHPPETSCESARFSQITLSQPRVDTPIIDAFFANYSDRGELALLMLEKWLIRLLHFGKTWEIRGSNILVRGKIYLARKDQIFGETYLVDAFSVTKLVLQSAAARLLHQIDDLSIVQYATPFAWVFARTRIYSRPVTFARMRGQVVWCRVNVLQFAQETQRISMAVNRLSDINWRRLSVSARYKCCTKEVGGMIVLCDVCNGEWHLYCLLHHFHVLMVEVVRITQPQESFVCINCL